ncbi:transglycosylase SLT domain-containing protein [Paraburkholderia bryophila]|uniref:Conjugative transfer protein CagX n=1 Tax=Paraburkholderia bryophila TaxID=420952 RepID=A0A329B6N4_9BURK|nr:conjugative transfer protein CagX [Paraburkholderia bryophila]
MQLQKHEPIAHALFPTAACIAALCFMHGTALADCIDDAAAFQHVNVSLMRGIAQVESGMQPNRVNTNSNGTTDIGLMQINSSWLPVLAREGISEQSLFDPCTNAYVGAWILSENIRQFGPNWNAVGAYNAASPDKRLSYARKVYDAVQSISASPDSSMPILPPSFTPPQTYSPFTSLEITPVQSGRPRAAAPAGTAGPAAAANGATGVNGASSTIAASAAYNFGWTVTGADQAKPMQVFDDGSKVFVQFVDMKHIPAIFAETPNGRVLLRWDLQFPYAVIARPEQTLIFQSGTFEARASRTPGTAAQPPASAASRDAAPAVASTTTSSPLATPTSRDQKTARTASTDALWYVSSPTTSKPQPQASAAQAAPLQAATEPRSAPPPSVPAPKAKPAPSTDALWYINAK